MFKEFWKEDTVLLTGAAKELAPVGAFANPLNTDVVDAEVDVLKVGAIDGKTAAPKLIAVDGVMVVTSETVGVFFRIG